MTSEVEGHGRADLVATRNALAVPVEASLTAERSFSSQNYNQDWLPAVTSSQALWEEHNCEVLLGMPANWLPSNVGKRSQKTITKSALCTEITGSGGPPQTRSWQ